MTGRNEEVEVDATSNFLATIDAIFSRVGSFNKFEVPGKEPPPNCSVSSLDWPPPD